MIRIVVISLFLTLLASLQGAESLREMANADQSGRLAHETDLRSTYRRGDASTKQNVLKALSTSDHPAAVKLAITLARDDRDPALITTVLNEVTDKPACAAALPEIRELANTRDPAVKRAAIKSLGTLKDDLASDLLVREVAGDDDIAAQEAQTALRNITGLQHRDAAAWEDWHVKETNRLETILPAVSRKLESDNPQEVLSAIQQLLQMKEHSGLAMEMLEPLLLADDPSVASVVQEGFAKLGGARGAYVLQSYDPDALADARADATIDSEDAPPEQIVRRPQVTEAAGEAPDEGFSMTGLILFMLLAGAGFIAWLKLRAPKQQQPPRR